LAYQDNEKQEKEEMV